MSVFFPMPILPPDLPSHRVVKLPALSPTMEAGMIVSWEKEVGDELSEGDTLAQVMGGGSEGVECEGGERGREKQTKQ